MLLISCGSPIHRAEITFDKIADCFVNPGVIDSVAIDNLSILSWDSLVKKAVCANASRPGVFTTVLKDLSSGDYTLGYLSPRSFKADSTYPLIIYLHGGTGSQLTTKGEKAYEMLLPLADTFALFLASPSANRNAPWWSPAGINRVLQTLRFMSMHFPINPEKVFLAGVSDGATGCWAMANTIPSPFAGFIAVSGFGGMLPSVAMPLFPSNIMQRPLYNVNAGKDRIYNIVEVNKFLDWCVDKGVRVERKEYPDELHGFDYRSKEFGTLANFIREWKRPTDSRGINWSVVQGFPNYADNLMGITADNSSQSPHITAFWKNDTLEINSEGLREAIVSFPNIVKDRISVCINKKRVSFVNALPMDAHLSRNLMMHACFPATSRSPCYRVQF